MKRPKVTSLTIPLSIIMLVAGTAAMGSAFEAHLIGVVARIEGAPGAPELSCPESFEVSDILSTDLLDVGEQNLIVRAGGVVQADDEMLEVKSRCDILVMSGGKIRANAELGGELRIDAKFNIIIEGSVEANGTVGEGGKIRAESDEGGIQIGASAVLSATGGEGGRVGLESKLDMSVLGLISVQGFSGDGGDIELESDADVLVESELRAGGTQEGGEIKFKVGGSAVLGGNSLYANGAGDDGGDIAITTGGSLTVDTLLTVQGVEDGGDIDIEVGGSAEFSPVSELLADALGPEGAGGRVGVLAADSIAAHGVMSAGGTEQAGEIELTACTIDTTGGAFNPAPILNTVCSAGEPEPVIAPDPSSVQQEGNDGSADEDGVSSAAGSAGSEDDQPASDEAGEEPLSDGDSSDADNTDGTDAAQSDTDQSDTDPAGLINQTINDALREASDRFFNDF